MITKNIDRILSDRPVFIVGCPRTGTSLLLTLLSDHKNVLVYPVELHFFADKPDNKELSIQRKRDFVLSTFVGALRKALREESFKYLFEINSSLRNFNSLYLERFDSLDGPHINLMQRLVFSYFLAFGLIDNDKKIWVEKTPKNEFHVDELLGMFPHAKFVHLVRDPRGYYLSRKLRFRRKKKPFSIHRICGDWNMSVASGLYNQKRLGSDRYHIVKYEELVLDTRQKMISICDFINIDFDDILLRPTLLDLDSSANSSFREKKKGVSKDGIDRWNGRLNSYEIFEIEQICLKNMKSMGYQPVYVNFNLKERVKHFLKSAKEDRYFINYLVSSFFNSQHLDKYILPDKKRLIDYYETKHQSSS